MACVVFFYFFQRYAGAKLNSNPSIDQAWGLSLVGRASDLHSEGQEFESPSLHFSAAVAQLVRARH